MAAQTHCWTDMWLEAVPCSVVAVVVAVRDALVGGLLVVVVPVLVV